ncbi:MAG: hypothetical protein OSA95_09740 [Opitutales bacterium]|nr:hypothetical protein [Opitutales bacterium]
MKIQKLLILVVTTLGLAFFSTSCGPSAKRGAVLGGIIGAGAGAIIGHQSDRPLEGAAIGGAVGAGAGGLLGGAKDDDRRAQDRRRGEVPERRYNNPDNRR